MAFTFTSQLHSLSSHPSFLSLKSFTLKPIPSLLKFRFPSLRHPPPLLAIGPDGKFYPTPSEDDPPEAPEDSAHGVSKFDQIHIQSARARKIQEEDFKNNQSTYLNAIADTEDPSVSSNYASDENSGDDLFGEIDKAIALKREEFIKQGLIKPRTNKENGNLVEGIEELEPEEVVDLDEINELQGLRVVDTESDEDDASGFDESIREKGKRDDRGLSLDPSFDLDFDSYGKGKATIVEPKFRMSLAELLDESKVVPVSVAGNLEVEITGIHHDSRMVSAGDLFVCCVGRRTDGHLYLTEADKRGAVAVVASKEIDMEETLGCKALVIVEDTNAVLPALAAAFYKYPSKNMAVVGITGTNGKTTTAYLIKGMYGAMGLRTGMLSTVAYYIHGDNKLESPSTTPDAVLVQNLIAKMLYNGTEAVVMETSSHGLALGRYDEVDFDIAVFTNLTRDHLDFHGTEEEYKDAKAKLFARMVDPERHRKIVNIDDPNASFFIAKGNPDVPVVTFAIENKSADVHPLKFELSLFETQVLVNTPHGILEISSGLLGRHNIYNILAAVAVGIAVGAPLEDIVRGIEEIDAVPGRCELIDEEQAFGVIVDYAQTPDALSRLLDSVRELGPKRIITVDILDDLLAGVGWTMQDYLKYGENDYYPPLPSGHRLFLHDIRRVAVRCAVAMGEEGDMVVIAGKGHETYQIEGDKNDFFDDREECREALQYVDELHQAGIDTSEFPWRLPESH
ncbi:UDP-N-acetylmuramoyl-L-alanyl-D-glutamate--2,6-diaminopimelate ligase MurE homolog, chloroplastic isoform X2 [Hevea brasiliensis]|uniref:UDP-N-acetylmuramoyl-L-alanyl-D-glutamate--2, 6-diaminopimelate ligase MurE homolog, chloroplastic isoform X2 n=1 Tax=Hevea brasiliensis TaxID=3981 RepID=UPI0025CBD6BE|nr:UDP-N-acetylmuramoyl-L-alanyl-D-glutamate--2,6-diaminopimelate ligase MurE homolog, chloroplastic isoform X2 [Hevea brasiliensis]